SPPGTECFDIFSPPPGDSEVVSQLERLNSNETKIAPRWVWIAVNGSDLSATTFMVSSKMDGSDRHFLCGIDSHPQHVMESQKKILWATDGRAPVGFGVQHPTQETANGDLV